MDLESFVGPVIGGVLAIIGGLAAAWWQSRRTEEVAVQLRRLEREEAGLLHMSTLVGEIFARFRMWADPNRETTENPSTQQQPAQEAGEFAGQLRIEWDREASWRVRSDDVRTQLQGLLEALDEASHGGYATSEEIVEVHNRSNGLAKAIEAALEGGS
jgi:hypothetical protein